MGAETDPQMAALARNVERATGRAQLEAKEALSEAVLARAEESGYVLVGPSARTWGRDPVTGQPTTPVSEAEHRAVRELLGRATLDTDEPEWVTTPDGQPEVHSTVVLATDHTDTADDGETKVAAMTDGPPIYDRPVSPNAQQLDIASDVGQMTDDQYEAWYRDCFEPHADADADADADDGAGADADDAGDGR